MPRAARPEACTAARRPGGPLPRRCHVRAGGCTLNAYFVAAAALAFGVGLAHTVMGELLIFRRLRKCRLVPTPAAPSLRERYVRILWASWHALTALGCGQAAVLLWLARRPVHLGPLAFVEHAIAASMLAAAALVLVGTQGRHPGWIGLAGVAALVWLGQAA